jgi:hypothetical protein
MKHLLIILALVMFKSGFAFAYSTNPYVNNNSGDNGSVNQYSDTITTNNINIKPFHLEIVAPSSGVQFYRNGIVFLAYSKDAEKMSQKHLSFGSVTPFIALVADTLLGQYMPFLHSSSLIFPAEATTFSKDFNTMYLSLIPEKDTREKIFKAEYTPNGWVIDGSPLSFCNVDYLFTHPALSNDGDFLIFSSNLKGSAGGLDLYISRKKDEEWSVPENLGGQINTTGNELFASLDADNNLYFSSDKLPGQGGYDIFVCAYDGKGWGKPQNLSKTINSENDEVAFTLNRENGKSAFYTSRERSGKERMQLNRVTLNPLLTNAGTQDLSKQFLAMTEIKELSMGVNQTTSAPVAQSIPKKVEPIAETAKPEAPAVVKETKKTSEVIKETKPAPVIASATEAKSDILVYRIQYAANTKPVGSQKITVTGKNYYSYEYLYKGGYRSTVGEFGTLAEASGFLNLCKQSGYNQSFLVAFKNGERITDAEAKVLEAQASKTATKEMAKTSEALKPTEIRQPAEKVNPQSSPLEIKEDNKPVATPSENKEGIIYRVQILANTKPVGSYNISISGKSYKTFEYLYKGGYRTTVGEFSTFKEAARLLNICRQSDYPEAFVVAFKDNVRTNDPSLLK